MNMLISFRSELLKTRRTATLYLTIIAAAVVPSISLLEIWLDGFSFDPGEDPFMSLIRQRFSFLNMVILPMYIMLVCTLLAQIEYRNNTWKQVFTSPQPKLNVFIARFLMVHAYIVLFILLYNVFMCVVAVSVHFMHPEVNLLNRPIDWGGVMTWNINSYLCVLGISAIQFWLGLRFRNFVVPLGTGLVLWMVGSMMVMGYNVPNSHFFPYSLPVLGSSEKSLALVPTVRLMSVGWMVVVLVLGWFDWRRGK